MIQSSSSDAVSLTPKQANIYVWGWQRSARFRDAVCGRRFGKTFLGKAEMRRAARLAQKWKVSVEDEIWYCAPTQKQAKRVFWRRLKQSIPPHWRASKPNETELSITLKSGHIMRCVGLNNYDDLRGSGLFFVLVDEWADCPYAAWEEVLRPMLSTCRYIVNGVQFIGGHALRIGTPKGFNHCYDSWLAGQDNREPDHKSWLYTSVDGGNVPPEELEAARRRMDPERSGRNMKLRSKTIRALSITALIAVKIILMKPLNQVKRCISVWTLTWGKWRQWFMCCVMGFHGL
ncbi:hypothetical protein K1S89_21305 [Klebsiella pneumoniae]|nr:hypothetical protein [Klebsiella pneumoniae]MCA5402369.1 hypothetical protein [Klebsiella pneumoniae]